MPAKTQKAITIHGAKDARVVSDRPIPTLRSDYILVKTIAVALNPTDWKHIDKLPAVGALVGCDYSGTVEEVGKDVTKPFKKGDRIAGFAHGANAVQHEDGTFAEYIVVKGDPQIHTPDNISDEEAATLGVGITTVGQGLYQSLKLPLPTQPAKEKFPVLVYGGSTATGSLAIQYAKLSNLTVVTTCSAKNFDFVRSMGADAAFDYKDPDCAKQIREYTNNNLKHVFDTISTEQSAKLCAEAMSSTGGIYSALLPVKNFPRQDVENKRTLAYTALGEYSTMGPGGPELPASKEDYEFGVMFWDMAQKSLAERKLKVHPPKVGKEGLKGVLDGLQLLRDDKVSGEKLVYRVSETP